MHSPGVRTKIIRTLTGLLVFLLVGLVILTIAVVISARPGDKALYPARPGETAVTVYVIHNWLHASLAVPATELRGRRDATASALERLPDAEWVLLGWGDAQHFRGRGDTPARRHSLVRSLVAPDNPSVILLDPEAEEPSPESRGRNVVRLVLSRRGFERLAGRLDRSFSLDATGAPRVAGRGRDPDSLFFYSREHADLAYTCNHWIADLLDAAGVPTTAVLDTVTAGLAWNLKLRGGAQDVPGPLGDGPDVGLETPPVHSGRFEPHSRSAERLTGAVTFEAYAIGLEQGQNLQTDPVRLITASERITPGGRTWSELLDVPPASLVELRRVTSRPSPRSFCGALPTEILALGFRTQDGERYEIAVAAFATPVGSSSQRLCDVFQYSQP